MHNNTRSAIKEAIMNQTTSKKILICDDEEGIRESLKLILGDHYDLILTDSGEQCLQCLEKDKTIGLVFLDIKMPKINGLEILNIIKEEYPNLKVIIVTGYKSVETASEAASLGASGYIVKPFKAEEILLTAKKYLF
jgi:DNA-binding NtrC family response regulator